MHRQLANHTPFCFLDWVYAFSLHDILSDLFCFLSEWNVDFVFTFQFIGLPVFLCVVDNDN